MPMLVTFEDLQSNLVPEDFDPAAGIEIERYPTSDVKTVKQRGQTDYLAIKNPERFEYTVARQQIVTKEYLDYFCNLKFIHLVSQGYEWVDLEEVKRRGIVLCNMQGVYSSHMAEDVVMRMIFLARKTFCTLENQRDKKWELVRPLDALFGCTAVILGAGTIASEIAKRLVSFDMNVIGIARSEREAPYFKKIYSVDKLGEVIGQADYIIGCLPKDDSTKNMVNRELISKMKDGVYFVNVGRGSTVDEAALLEAMNSGKIAGASCDVFQQEPLPQDSPFWTQPNFLLTPHNSGGHYKGAGLQRRQLIGKNISNFILGRPVVNRIV